jgi:hypothetical protein
MLHSSVEVSTCVAASLVLSRGLVRAISVERRTMGTLVMRLCDQPENGPCHVNNFGSCRVRKIEPFFLYCNLDQYSRLPQGSCQIRAFHADCWVETRRLRLCRDSVELKNEADTFLSSNVTADMSPPL